MNLPLELLVGLASLAVGTVLLVTRVNPLRFGEHRFDYVMLHICLAAMCFYSGVTLVGGVVQLGLLHVLSSVSSVCYISYTGGVRWAPPSYMRTKKAGVT